ncbi:MAG: FtsP/CotA-like multicopper oxidase with cupredoxin domain [Akkermansiaceae bacterium]|jgi:FtsP/CotA-like multicopper oxidase with cupredoxin domain
MGGIGGLSQASIAPRETCKYEFTLKQHGTFMNHSHHDEMTTMGGIFIILRRRPNPADSPGEGGC